jgi:hypothetical protein
MVFQIVSHLSIGAALRIQRLPERNTLAYSGKAYVTGGKDL